MLTLLMALLACSGGSKDSTGASEGDTDTDTDTDTDSDTDTDTDTDTDLETDLVAYYELEKDGTDYTGRGNDLTWGKSSDGSPTGEPEFVSGFVDNGMNGGGTGYGNALFAESTKDLELTGDFTISLWVRRGKSPYDSDHLIAKENEFMMFRNDSYSGMVFHLYDGTTLLGEVVDDSGTGVPGGIWIHVVAWRSGDTIGIEIDDSGTATTKLSGTPTGDTKPFYLGRSYAGYPWAGMIDEVGIWKRALAPDEITTLYNKGLGLRPTLP